MGNDYLKTAYCSPLRYPGGKNLIFDFISATIRNNGLIGIDYAEPYAGGAGLALRLLFNEYVSKIFINDLDPAIYSLWKIILDEPDRFCSWIEDVPLTIEEWKKHKQIQSEINKHSLDEIAKSTFYLNRTNVSGVIKGGVIGGLDQKGKYKINARFNRSSLISKVQDISNYRSRITLSNLDGIKFVEKMNRRSKQTLIYLDPPYYQKGSRLYMNYYIDKDHAKLAEKIKTLSAPWITSYDNHEFIKSLYPSFKKYSYKISQNTSNRIGDEILIFSNKIQPDDSICYLDSALAI